MTIEGLTAGRVVHYVPRNDETMRGGLTHGTHRAAVVVYVWGQDGTADLLIFWDGQNDGRSQSQPVEWKTSVHYDPTGETLGSFHFIERA